MSRLEWQTIHPLFRWAFIDLVIGPLDLLLFEDVVGISMPYLCYQVLILSVFALDFQQEKRLSLIAV